MRALPRLPGLTRLLATVIAWALLGLGCGLLASVAMPMLLGGRSLTVLTGSMEPTLEARDVIVTRPISPLAARVGDVVTFHDPERPSRLLTHRVRHIEIRGDRVDFETKGQANNTPETWTLPAASHIGRVSYRVPKVGLLLQWVTAWPVPSVLLGVSGVGWGVLTLLRIWGLGPPPESPGQPWPGPKRRRPRVA